MTSERTGKIQTVLGLIEPEELGITLTHEHFLIDLSCYFMEPEEASERAFIDKPITMDIAGKAFKRIWYSHDFQRLLDEEAATKEIMKYMLAGGHSIVDATSMGIGRDPLALARMSRRTGLNVVMGASHYVPAAHPADIADRSEQEITDYIIRDVTVGVGETGVRSGIIGEIGNWWPTDENTRKILRASVHAANETGAPILIHPGFHPDSPMHIMNDLLEAGVDPTRVIMGHLDAFSDLTPVREVAETGANLEYDRFGWEDTSLDLGNVPGVGIPTDVQRFEFFEQLIEWGYEDRLVVAHDVCFKTDWTSHGGKGFAHILESIVPRMRARGFSEDTINNILVENPRRILTFS